ncbi:TonB-dependent receptor plug domain-containing protein [Nibribacter ruber]|uniref:TonB-dependent receptor plug domain-containing protein n=2 Tax=Nibribacter ruber TaxID=2698458 RepID=A0A6P1P510_9BACT|nr:TonB-dependent receptor plug domain-containing protein [Nibribacter ruber]
MVTGQVQEAQTRKPLVGVAVTGVGTSAGTVTDAEGRFSLEVPVDATAVSVSLLGYKTVVVALPTASQDLLILLSPEVTRLREVVVTGYETRRPLQETAGAIGVLSGRELQRFSETTLVPALNTLPGVRMEERATASYRLSIRGSSLRAPFGVRNVKVYLNEIPLVEANGTIPLNLLDAATIGNVEVIKGPAGSVYGAGTGGTVLLETTRSSESSVMAGGLVGSYGLRRGFAGASVATEKSNLLLRYDRQALDGYREQSAMDRQTVLLSGQFYPTQKQTFSFHALYSDLYYELPGALTREQYEANPRQARQLNKDQNASINLDGLNLGLVHSYQFNDRWSNSTSLFGVFSFLNHPFTNDYERNTNQSFGGRTRTTYRTQLAQLPTRLVFGAEGQRSFVNSRHYQNVKGSAGTLSFDDEVMATQGFVFGQAELELPSQFILTLGGSLNTLHYDLTRVTTGTTGLGSSNSRGFDPQFSPRVGLVKVFWPQFSAHASISAGFSPPTEAEVRPSDGSFNTALQPEQGTNYELGVRGSLWKERLVYDIVGFRLDLKETILIQSTPQDIDVFQNAGATRQQGLEVALGYTLLQAPQQPVSLLRVWTAYTYNHFRFRNYQPNEDDFSGNTLTGTPAHVLTAGLDAESPLGVYLNLTTIYTSDLPLNDANTVYADAYLVFGGKVGFRRTLGQTWHIDLYGGVENATDELYSLGNDLNGFGNRYFQAAPGRNFYSALQLRKSF